MSTFTFIKDLIVNSVKLKLSRNAPVSQSVGALEREGTWIPGLAQPLSALGVGLWGCSSAWCHFSTSSALKTSLTWFDSDFQGWILKSELVRCLFSAVLFMGMSPVFFMFWWCLWKLRGSNPLGLGYVIPVAAYLAVTYLKHFHL